MSVQCVSGICKCWKLEARRLSEESLPPEGWQFKSRCRLGRFCRREINQANSIIVVIKKFVLSVCIFLKFPSVLCVAFLPFLVDLNNKAVCVTFLTLPHQSYSDIIRQTKNKQKKKKAQASCTKRQ